jgi:hypothetical protein
MTIPAVVRFASGLVLGLVCFVCTAVAQTETGTVSGLVTDTSGAAVPGAEVQLLNVARGTAIDAKTNGAGIYVFNAVQPGLYHLRALKQGFKQVDLMSLIVNVQDHIEQNVRLQVGSVSESITVNASETHIDTEDATVSTLVDRKFIENMPLNGRSFQSLISLTPGSVTAKSYFTGIGQFSINGQRTDTNYFSIDGASANVGITQGANVSLGAAGAGAAQATSNNGGYNNLVSVDALQEFKIQTSTFDPEYGRTPGAQVSIVTKSGTNQLHGVLFEYLRNEVFDSRDYFARVNNLPKPAEKQNDFGGTLGGPILRNRVFFFFSYEGQRLRVPFTRTEVVPSTWLRANAIAAVKPLLNAYPLPTNGDMTGVPTATTISTFSNPSVLNATSLRLDYMATPKLSLFVRGNYGPSNGSQHGAFDFYSRSTYSTTASNVGTITGGATYMISDRVVDDLRVNVSQTKGATTVAPTTFGGAVIPSDSFLFQTNPTYSTANSVFGLIMLDGSSGYFVGNDATNHQHQFNILDSVSWTRGLHSLKFGVDYRRLTPTNGYRPFNIFYVANSFSNLAKGTINNVSVGFSDASILRPVFTNMSLYARDAWHVSSRLTLTYGVRWDYDPPPGENSGHPFYTAINLNDPAHVALAPGGTPLWQANKHNFVPRIGAAYSVRNAGGKELVIRAGWGIFYGLGNQQGAQGTQGFPYGRTRTLFGTDSGSGTQTFPVSPADGAPIPFTLAPPYSSVFAFDPHLKDPRVYHWNVTAESSLGMSRSLQIGYVGNKGDDLLRRSMLTPAMGGNPNFQRLDVITNDGWSNYNALQAQFKQHAWHGLQTIASYTWSHAIDNGSSVNNPSPYSNVYNPNWDRGNSDFDMRHSFSTAVTYEIPRVQAGNRFISSLTGGWAIDSLFRANSSVPVNISTGAFAFGLIWNGDATNQRPNIVSGQPFYLYGPQYPGGKRINPAAFVAPKDSFTQGDLARNVLRGFGAWQEDLALRRTFNLTERVHLLFRAEAFNIFNHSNFGDPGAQSDGANHLNNPKFGLSTQILSNSLGSGGADGGFSSLYQMGGPRSLQFALKLQF